jgi:hypothetical protein
VKRTAYLPFVIALLIVVIAAQWHARRADPTAETNAAPPAGVVDPGAGRAAGETQISEPTPSRSIEPAPAGNAEPTPTSASADTDFKEVVEGIDPALEDRNLIVRGQDQRPPVPDLVNLELRFSEEGADPAWSNEAKRKILDQVAQLSGLGLATLDAECRETICRVKLFFPPGAKPVLSFDALQPIAKQVGLPYFVQVATAGEQGVPMSLWYFWK